MGPLHKAKEINCSALDCISSRPLATIASISAPRPSFPTQVAKSLANSTPALANLCKRGRQAVTQPHHPDGQELISHAGPRNHQFQQLIPKQSVHWGVMFQFFRLWEEEAAKQNNTDSCSGSHALRSNLRPFAGWAPNRHWPAVPPSTRASISGSQARIWRDRARSLQAVKHTASPQHHPSPLLPSPWCSPER